VNTPTVTFLGPVVRSCLVAWMAAEAAHGVALSIRMLSRPAPHAKPASPAAHHHALVFDEEREEVVLFGGSVDDAPASAATWALGRGGWSRRTAEGPSPRASVGLPCTGNWKDVPDSESIVYKPGARDVIPHHWEWFFDEQPYRKRRFLGLPGSPADEYGYRVVEQLRKLGVSQPTEHDRIPQPGLRYELRDVLPSRPQICGPRTCKTSPLGSASATTLPPRRPNSPACTGWLTPP
jgi:hypothetical protein